MTAALLTATDVQFTYGSGALVLDVPRFSAGPGVHHLVGLNGSGKSTFIKLLSGVLRPQAGAVAFRGAPIATAEGYREFCRRSGYLWQNFHLRGSTPAHTYLAYRAWLHGLPSTSTAEAASQALGTVGMSAEAKTSVGKLSGGMQRRVGIAAETLHQPEVLLLDEPASGLDYRAADLVYDAIDAMVATDSTVITVAHEPDVLARHKATVHVMAGGRLVRSETFAPGEMSSAVLRELVEDAR